MPGRNTNAGNYRYGYQNQECDPEISGEGNSYAFEYRFHDPRLGRFLSIDPLSAKYPYNSPYAFSENRLIDSRELEGLERIGVNLGAVEGDPNVKSVTFTNLGESENLQVYYPGDDLNGPGRPDFIEGSYEQTLMHQMVRVRPANGSTDAQGNYTFEEVPMYKAGVSDGQQAKYYRDQEGRLGVGFGSFFMLNVEFKAPDKTSADANGVVNWAAMKTSLNFLAQIMLDPSKALRATGSRLSYTSANTTNPNLYKMTFLTIGYHSPHDFDGLSSADSDVYNLGLAQSRADNLSKYLVNKGVPALRLYTSNKGEDAIRRAQIIIHSERVIQGVDGVVPFNH